MTAGLAALDAGDLLPSNPKLLRQIDATFARVGTTIDLAGLLIGQLGLAVSVAACCGFGMGVATILRTLCLPSFCHHIVYVVLASAKEHMRRIDAAGVIAAGTIVKHPEAIGDRAAQQFPRDPLRRNTVPLAFDRIAENAMTVVATTQLPQPTVMMVTAFDGGPISFDCFWGNWGRMTTSIVVPCSGRWERPRRGFMLSPNYSIGEG